VRGQVIFVENSGSGGELLSSSIVGNPSSTGQSSAFFKIVKAMLYNVPALDFRLGEDDHVVVPPLFIGV
jgi:hypothetical protein